MKEKHEQIENELRDALSLVRANVPEEEFKLISEFLDNNELGLAFETLVDVFSEENLKLEPEPFSLMKKAAKMMGYDKVGHIDSDYWEEFKNISACNK